MSERIGKILVYINITGTSTPLIPGLSSKNIAFLHPPIAYEKASRQQRLRTEIAQAQRENKAYVANVERSKMVANMEEKKRRRKEEGKEDTTEKVEEIRRTFKQRKLVTREAVEGTDAAKAMDKVEPAVKSVLGKVFGDK